MVRYWSGINSGSDHTDFPKIEHGYPYMPEARSPSINSRSHSPKVMELLAPLNDIIDDAVGPSDELPDENPLDTTFDTNYDMPDTEMEDTLDAPLGRGSPELMLAQFYGHPPPCPCHLTLPPSYNEESELSFIPMSPITSEVLEDEDLPGSTSADKCNMARTRSPSLTLSSSHMQVDCPVMPLAAIMDQAAIPRSVSLKTETSCCSSRASSPSSQSTRTELRCQSVCAPTNEESCCSNVALMKSQNMCDVSVQAGKMIKRVKLQGLAKSCARALLGEHVRRAHRHLRALMRLRQLLGRERFDRSCSHSAPVKIGQISYSSTVY